MLTVVGLQNKIGHPAHRYRQLMQIPVLSARGIQTGSKTCVIGCCCCCCFLFFGLLCLFFFGGARSEIVDII